MFLRSSSPPSDWPHQRPEPRRGKHLPSPAPVPGPAGSGSNRTPRRQRTPPRRGGFSDNPAPPTQGRTAAWPPPAHRSVASGCENFSLPLKSRSRSDQSGVPPFRPDRGLGTVPNTASGNITGESAFPAQCFSRFYISYRVLSLSDKRQFRHTAPTWSVS